MGNITAIQGGLHGIQTGGMTLETIMLVFLCIALYNAIELLIQISVYFKRHIGLYFWAMLIATCGIPIHITGFTLKYWGKTVPYELSCTLIQIGWICFITGQSLVLYSRLHLVLISPRIQRAVLIMILVDAAILHTLLTVGVFIANSPKYKPFMKTFVICEKIQMVVFSCQEFVISGLYVWATMKRLAATKTIKVRMLRWLVIINCLIMFMDVCLLAMVFSNFYEIETSVKPLVYTIKLKLEFAILNLLLRYSRRSVREAGDSTEKALADKYRRQKMGSDGLPGAPFNSSSTQVPANRRRPGIQQTTTVSVESDDKATEMADNPLEHDLVPPGHDASTSVYDSGLGRSESTRSRGNQQLPCRFCSHSGDLGNRVDVQHAV